MKTLPKNEIPCQIRSHAFIPLKNIQTLPLSLFQLLDQSRGVSLHDTPTLPNGLLVGRGTEVLAHSRMLLLAWRGEDTINSLGVWRHGRPVCL